MPGSSGTPDDSHTQPGAPGQSSSASTSNKSCVGQHGPALMTKRRAWLCVVGAVASAAAGIAVYVNKTPGITDPVTGHRAGRLDMPAIALAGQPWPWPDGVASAARWDFVLIAGYTTALGLGLCLARAVFGRAALADWPTLEKTRQERRNQRAKRLAWLVGSAAALAVACDVTEDLLLMLAADATKKPGSLLVALTAVSVTKFCLLAPTMLIALLGIAVAVGRLIRKLPFRKMKLADCPFTPSGTPTQPTGAVRWRRAYVVPGIEAELAERAKSPEQTVGICLSGGGVRSASVALGAMQAMRTELRNARYLASVSGGGYTAGALQLALTSGGAPNGSDGRISDPETALTPGTVEEDHVRRHASYIADGAGQLTVALGVVARGLILSLFILLAPALVLGYLIGRASTALPISGWTSQSLYPWAPHLAYPSVRSGTMFALIAFAGLAAVLYCVALFREALRAEVATRLRHVAGGVLALGLLVAALAVGLPSLAFGAAWVASKGHAPVTVLGSVGSLLLSYGAALIAIARSRGSAGKDKSKTNKKTKKSDSSPVSQATRATPAGALQSALVALALIVLTAMWLILLGGTAAIARRPGVMWTVAVVGAVLAAVLLVVDVPAMSLHPFYRRRLASAFAVRRWHENGETVPMPYEYAERTALSRYGTRVLTGGEPVFPEVIFSAAANLTGEQRAPLKAVGFTFTGEWVGGPDVGYVRTGALESNVGPQLAGDLTVQAAVAISGAAFASSMGRMGRWYTTLLAISGARLGSWLPNPAFVRGARAANTAKDWTVPRMPKIRRLPYLLRELFGVHRCDDRLLQITDGGHYENLGLVELLRRRCDLIYCIDASGDTPPTAATLRQALSLASAELGVKFQGTEALWGLVPGSGSKVKPTGPLAALNDKLSSTATIRLTFEYPEESGLPSGRRSGTLIIAKAALTPKMNYGLLARGASDPLFPRDPTSDQFFDDDKYCSYTALGRTLGLAALAKHDEVASMLIKQPTPGVRQLVDD